LQGEAEGCDETDALADRMMVQQRGEVAIGRPREATMLVA
jgi:hypothetical protein